MRLDPLMTCSPVTGAIRHLTEDLLGEVYLAPAPQNIDLEKHLASRDAPWAASFSAAPEETTRAIEQALLHLMRATPSLDPEAIELEALPTGRAREHLTALRTLWLDLDTLPTPVSLFAHILKSKADDTLEPLPLLETGNCPFTDPLEIAVANVLRAHHGTAAPTTSEAWLERQPARVRASIGALGHIQEHLGKASSSVSPDHTVALIAVRDPQEEAEYAAARAQRMLEDGTVDTASEIGILAPDTPAYQLALQEAFDRVGLPLSGLPNEPARRDTEGELLQTVLSILEGPTAPRTALASLYVNPYMPWPRETGRRMAREMMDRGYSRTAKNLEGPGRELLHQLRPAVSSKDLVARLFSIAGLLPNLSLGPRIGELRAGLGETLDWPTLRRIALPRPPLESGPNRFIEGVSLFKETALPWRSVRHLITLGLRGPHWPGPTSSSPLFTESEIDLIHDKTGLPLRGRQHQVARGVGLFRRQLCAATEGATLLLSARDMHGETLAPSTGLALIGHMLGAETLDDLLYDPRRQADETWPVEQITISPQPNGSAPILPQDGRLVLNQDLLSLRQNKDGTSVPQSPSRLETLLVSPLAWVLDELDAKDRTWLPETLDVMALGTLVHHVLETVFPGGTNVPPPEHIKERVSEALKDGIRRHAAWLQEQGWAAERANLLREALDIAQNWGRVLSQSDAEIIENEIDLAGHHNGLLIAGRADTVLRLPCGRVLVVDFKRSHAGSRRDRISKSWDLQVALYRAMLEHPSSETTVSKLAAANASTITAYYTMLDNTLLVDETKTTIPGAEPAGSDILSDVSAFGTDLRFS